MAVSIPGNIQHTYLHSQKRNQTRILVHRIYWKRHTVKDLVGFSCSPIWLSVGLNFKYSEVFFFLKLFKKLV